MIKLRVLKCEDYAGRPKVITSVYKIRRHFLRRDQRKTSTMEAPLERCYIVGLEGGGRGA